MNACIIVLLSNEFSASGHKFVPSIALFQMVETAQNSVIYVQLLVSGHLKCPTAGFQTTLQKQGSEISSLLRSGLLLYDTILRRWQL